MTREEAIKELRGFIGQLTEGCQEAIKVLIPELHESEDERIRRTLVEYFGPQAQLDFIRGVPIQKIRDWLEKQKEPENTSASTMAPSCWAVEQKEQKPAEWSEEDEAFLKVAIAICNRYSHKDIADWLKSLRPQPHWKPSEEQIEALEYELGHGGRYDKVALESLLTELKKL